MRWLVALCPAMWAAVVAVLAAWPALAGSGAPFGAKNIAAGSLAVALFGMGICWPLPALFRAWEASNDLRSHQLCLLWRWRVLVDRAVSGGEAGGGKRQGDEEQPAPPSGAKGRLVAHKERDPNCPCWLPSCAGNLPRRNGWWMLGDFLVRMVMLGFGVHFSPLWTPVVSSAVLWRTWWGGLIGAAVLATILFWAFFIAARVFRFSRAPMTQLSQRLICRCLTIEIGRMLDGYRQTPASQTDGALDKHDWASVYAILEHLAHAWHGWQTALMASTRSWTVSALALLPAVALNLAAGACIPLWELLAGAWWLGFTLDNLAVYAASNARIGAAAAVLRAGADAARAIALRSGSDAERGALACHAARLEACAAGWQPARFFGFEVTYGALRALVATLLTVVFALWGILRGLGITVVLESYCYG